MTDTPPHVRTIGWSLSAALPLLVAACSGSADTAPPGGGDAIDVSGGRADVSGWHDADSPGDTTPANDLADAGTAPDSADASSAEDVDAPDSADGEGIFAAEDVGQPGVEDGGAILPPDAADADVPPSDDVPPVEDVPPTEDTLAADDVPPAEDLPPSEDVPIVEEIGSDDAVVDGADNTPEDTATPEDTTPPEDTGPPPPPLNIAGTRCLQGTAVLTGTQDPCPFPFPAALVVTQAAEAATGTATGWLDQLVVIDAQGEEQPVNSVEDAATYEADGLFADFVQLIFTLTATNTAIALAEPVSGAACTGTLETGGVLLLTCSAPISPTETTSCAAEYRISSSGTCGDTVLFSNLVENFCFATEEQNAFTSCLYLDSVIQAGQPLPLLTSNTFAVIHKGVLTLIISGIGQKVPDKKDSVTQPTNFINQPVVLAPLPHSAAAASLGTYFWPKVGEETQESYTYWIDSQPFLGLFRLYTEQPLSDGNSCLASYAPRSVLDSAVDEQCNEWLQQTPAQ